MFIDPSYHFKELLVSFSKFSLEHGGGQISSTAIVSVSVEYKVASKVIGVTTNDTANNLSRMFYLQEFLEERRTSIGRSVAARESLVHFVKILGSIV
jgi:hypothetical protein